MERPIGTPVPYTVYNACAQKVRAFGKLLEGLAELLPVEDEWQHEMDTLKHALGVGERRRRMPVFLMVGSLLRLLW